jgi:hypothetical protein
MRFTCLGPAAWGGGRWLGRHLISGPRDRFKGCWDLGCRVRARSRKVSGVICKVKGF